VKQLIKTEKVLVFYHPKPSWEDHVLLVPKKSLRNLLELGQPQNTQYFSDILLAAKEVIQLTNLTGQNYVLCANGGTRQEVQQVHFHLFTKESYANPFVQPIPEKFLYENDKI
jgi:diadenosine tetraphosphate (Ap4A) HIT family hydrolase